jgi:predicted  nucleic acid-binding Zn ribbon protein
MTQSGDPKRWHRHINLNHLPTACFTLLVSGVHGATYRYESRPCPRCGGNLEFKANVSSLGQGSEICFFECKDCDHIHTVDETRLDTDADR